MNKNTELTLRHVANKPKPATYLNELFNGFLQSYKNNKSIKVTLSVKDNNNMWHNLQVRQFKNGSIHIRNF